MKKYILVLIIIFAAFLRFYKIAEVPPSLYWDEASLGYNVYSILKTAKDEHGKFLPLTNFSAFGDYKPPGYIYATVPSIAVFGLSEFAIRFPSAFFGTLTVLLTFILAKKIFNNETIAYISSLFLAISPWHVNLSRAAFESNMALFFSTLGIYFFIKFAKDSSYFIFLSAASFLIAMYTFTGQRLFVPLVLILLVLQFKKEVYKNLKVVAVASFFALVLFWPLFKFATQTIEGRLRFDEVSIFKDLTPINQSIEYRKRDNYSFVSNLIYNRRLFYLHEYLENYFDAFSPVFLFTKGDINPRFSTQLIGQLYPLDLLFVMAGLYFLIRKRNEYAFLIIGWLLVSPLGPATAKETPHALRMLHILPTFQLIGAFGLYHFLSSVKSKKILIPVLSLALVAQLLFYLHSYYVHWPKTYSGEWQYGYKEAVKETQKRYNEFDNIVVTPNLGRPYIYFLLYMKFPPQKYHESARRIRDRFYFYDVEGFDKFYFNNPSPSLLKGNTLYISQEGNLPKNAKSFFKVKDLSGATVFEMGEKIK